MYLLLVSIFFINQWGEEVKFTDNTHCDMTPTVTMTYAAPTMVWIYSDSVYISSYYGGDEIWSEPVRVSPNTVTCNNDPSLWNNTIFVHRLVWQGIENDSFGIYSYWSGNVTKIASSEDSVGHPDIASSFDYLWVVWEGFDGNDWEIFYRRQESSGIWEPVVQLTDNEYDDRYPEMGSMYDVCITWQSFDGEDWEIMSAVWNVDQYEIIPVTDNSIQDINPSITFSDFTSPPAFTIAWQSWDDNDYEIYFCEHYGDSCGTPVQLTNNSVDDENPAIEWGWVDPGNLTGNCIVWQRFDGEDYEIMGWLEWMGDAILQLSDEDSLDDVNPAITACKAAPVRNYYPGICVAWQGFDGNDWEIFYRFGYSPAEGGIEFNDVIPKVTSMKLQVCPNPFTAGINVRCSGTRKGERISLQIYDLAGRLIKSFPLVTDHSPLITDLAPGIYFLKAEGYKPVKVVKLR